MGRSGEDCQAVGTVKWQKIKGLKMGVGLVYLRDRMKSGWGSFRGAPRAKCHSSLPCWGWPSRSSHCCLTVPCPPSLRWPVAPQNACRQIQLTDPHLSAKPRQRSIIHLIVTKCQAAVGTGEFGISEGVVEIWHGLHPEITCRPGREGWSRASQEGAWDSWGRRMAQSGRDGVGLEGRTGYQWRKDSASPFRKKAITLFLLSVLGAIRPYLDEPVTFQPVTIA